MIFHMDVMIPIFPDLTLKIADRPNDQRVYPTARLPKGFRLNYRGRDLAEEAVGFGLPVLKQGLQTIFPGNVELDHLHVDSTWVVTAIYTMDLVEKIARPGSASIKSKYLYNAKNYLAASIRQFPPIRGFLTSISNGLRWLFGWETTYEKADFSTQVKIIYTFEEERKELAIEADLSCLPPDKVTEVILMNEQGAQTFDQYRDSSLTHLSGKEIGCWDEVNADEASFMSSTQRIAFTLSRVGGAHLYRGRELIDARLAWAGFGYSLPPASRGFRYTVKFEKLA
jgi:hypothetical protein